MPSIEDYRPTADTRDTTLDLNLTRTTSDTAAGLSSSGASSEQARLETSPVAGSYAVCFYSSNNAQGAMEVAGSTSVDAVTIPFRGSLIGITVDAQAAASGTYEVEINGSTSNLTCRLPAGVSAYSSILKGTVPVAAGDKISVNIDSSATTTQIIVHVYVTFDQGSVL